MAVLVVIDNQGSRIREWCQDCHRYHKAANCPKAKKRRQRAANRDRRWFSDMLSIRDSVAERTAREA